MECRRQLQQKPVPFENLKSTNQETTFNKLKQEQLKGYVGSNDNGIYYFSIPIQKDNIQNIVLYFGTKDIFDFKDEKVTRMVKVYNNCEIEEINLQ